MSPNSTFSEDELRRLSWQWAYCYDNKNWQKLRSICADDFKMFYGELDPKLGDKIVPAEEFISVMSAPTALGDHRLKTMHFLGGVVFEQDSEGVTAHWQIQGLHRRLLADGTTSSWNGFNYVQHFYGPDKDGKWKLAGVKPTKPLFMDGSPHQVIGAFD